jgi:prolyl 4-hydroxylase
MFLYVISLILAGPSVQAQDVTYGVDCSFPIHSEEFRCGDLLGDRKRVYDEYMRGCLEAFGSSKGESCGSIEEDRLEMSLRQPQSMVVRDT